MPLDLVLRRPTEDEEREFLRAHRGASPGYPSFLYNYEPGMPFRQYLEVLADQEQGINGEAIPSFPAHCLTVPLVLKTQPVDETSNSAAR
jgi:hypothetical protein